MRKKPMRLLMIFLVIPLLVAAALMIINLASIDSEAHYVIGTAEGILHRIVPILGCLFAMSTFLRSDYLYKAWGFVAACAFFLLVRDLATMLMNVPDWFVALFSVFANISNVIGFILMARAWQVAGLSLPIKRTQKITLVSITIGVALAVSGVAIVISLQKISTGDLMGVRGLASSIGDLITFSFIAPLFLTALALRGGALICPWALITASRLAWLFLDTTQFAGQWIGLSTSVTLSVGSLFRSLATFLTFSAGLAQYLVSKTLQSESKSKREASTQTGLILDA